MTENRLNQSIANISAFILRNPSCFFSEADIQAIFYDKLKELEELNLFYDTGCSIGLNQYREASEKKYQTYSIHREYGLNNGKSSRVDLAILNPKDIPHIVDPINLKDANNDYLKPDFIFEFGTEKSAKSSETLENHLRKDVEKLGYAEKRGYLIHVQRNYLEGKETASNIEKHDNYTKALSEIIKELSESEKRKIKILYFKVDLGGPKRILKKTGKVKMFKNNVLKGISQENIEKEIMNLIQ